MRVFAVVIAIGVLLLGVLMGVSFCEKNRLEPKEGVTTLQEFAQDAPYCEKLAVVDGYAGKHLVWIGDRVTVFLGPSGPSAYIFDMKGNLVHWLLITGDGGDYNDYAMRVYDPDIQSIELEDALARFIP